MDIQSNIATIHCGASQNRGDGARISGAAKDTDTERKVTEVEKIDFQNMTVGQYIDTLNYLRRSGQITDDEALDIYITCIPPTTPCATQEEHLAMPMRISYERLRSEMVELAASGKFEERDRHQRVLDLLMRLDGSPRSVYATA